VADLRQGLAWDADGAEGDVCPVAADEAVIADGSSVVLATAGGCDPALVAAWFAERFAGLSSETLYARLWVLLEQLDRAVDRAPATAVRRDDQAVAALTGDGVLVGIARCLSGEERASAELEVAVAPSWQRRGILPVLLERLSASAHAAGIERLTTRCPAGAS
jgi:GNAT superfamily N-acetyltransferase